MLFLQRVARVFKRCSQALVLPLTVATKSSVEPLVRSTQKLLDLLCEDFGELVHQSPPWRSPTGLFLRLETLKRKRKDMDICKI